MSQEIPVDRETSSPVARSPAFATSRGAESDSGPETDPDVRDAIRRIEKAAEERGDEPLDSEGAASLAAEVYEGDRLSAMRELLEEPHLRIVQQLLASDTGALSPREVAFRNEGVISESTVRDHLRTLTGKGLVEKLEPDVEPIPNEMPRTFYAASPLAIELLQQLGLWESLGLLYDVYDALDRPDDVARIESWEDRPVPQWLE